MARINLFPGNSVYVDYEFSSDEIRIQEMLQEKLGLELEMPQFKHMYPELPGEVFPVNFGYEAGVVGEGKYHGVGARHHRRIYIMGVAPLESALRELSDDSRVYQSLKFAYSDDKYKEDFDFDPWQLRKVPDEKVDVNISTKHYKSRRLRNSLLQNYGELSEVVFAEEGRYRELYKIDADFTEVCESAIDGIYTMKWQGI